MTRRLAAALLLLIATGATAAEPVIREGLMLPGGGRRGRREAVPSDPVVARIVAGTWAMPRAGDVLAAGEGRERKWEPITAGDDGFRVPPGSYLAVDAASDEDRVAILEATGHGSAYVGDEPRVGDPYGTGYVRIPVKLRKGSNPLLFLGGRGRPIPVKLMSPKAAAVLNAGDPTLPDLLRDVALEAEAAVVVINATDAPLDGLAIVAQIDGGPEVRTAVPRLPALAVRKVGFAIRAEAKPGTEDRPLAIRLVGADGQALDKATLPLRVRGMGGKEIKRTFRSEIDGSVQYYAHVGQAGQSGLKPGLVLSLHGASVEASGQAAAYRAKPGLEIVAPTNRRPYGFDWEDWGRKDAMEVLDDFIAGGNVEPDLVYLTGHSMGGHGTWHLGVTYPDRFAAIAPSAGWVSMFSYAGASRTEAPEPVDELIARATNPSDTLALVGNLAGLGVYVLHGDADDNVPVAQARTMREQLAKFHPDFVYREVPGAGHWWGNECVDYPAIFDFLFARTLRVDGFVDPALKVDFVTMSPGVSSRRRWAAVESQPHAMKRSTLHLVADREKRRVEGTTENVSRLTLDLAPALHGEGPAEASLDGQVLKVETPTVRLKRSEDGAWSVFDGPGPTALKGPRRYGPFKEAFDNRFVLVYGTAGTDEEDAATLARARADAEAFWYRGNGSMDVVGDAEFLDPARAEEFRGRNVILYGHAATNAAWAPLLGDGPVHVGPGAVKFGGDEIKGDDLACLFIRPRPGSDVASVAAVSGTGPKGLRLSATLPYFVSGTGFPDLLIVRAAGEDRPARAVAAGYFGEDWGVDSGEFARRD